VSKAVVEIERIIFADEETRNKLRQEQLKIVAQLKNEPNVNLPLIPLSEDTSFKVDFKVDLSLTTPYGPPSPDAYVIPVPNDCVGLVIGKGGDTIKMLQVNSGARKVQVAADSNPNSSTRNVFVEGDRESINRVKKMLQDIIDTQQKLKNALGGGGGKSTKMDVPVPDNLVGLIIGK
jgi:far upstream element-binding protein